LEAGRRIIADQATAILEFGGIANSLFATDEKADEQRKIQQHSN